MKKNILFFYFLLSSIIAFADKPNVLVISKLTDSVNQIDLDRYWKFHNGDDSVWALPSFDDSRWDTVNTLLKFKKDSNVFKGIAWFRIHIYIDPSLNNTTLSLLIDQEGASQIFLDGKLIHSLGTVSSDINKEKKYDPHSIPLSFKYGNTGEYLLAVRYSNLNYLKFFEKYKKNRAGFSIQIAKQDDSVFTNLKNTLVRSFLGIFLGIFFLTLGFVHLLFFLFYRKQHTNLYYSIFVVLFGIFFLIPTYSYNTSNPEVSIKLNYYYFNFLQPIFFYSMLILEYSFFKKNFAKGLAITTVIIILIALIISLVFGRDNFWPNFIFGFIIGSVCSSFSIVIVAIKRKIAGAWIIGTGSLFFLIFLVIIIITIITTQHLSFSLSINSTSGFMLLILIMLAFMSIPISMSIHLAREFAQTNKQLEKNLIEVKTLSEKSIEQEKEKQKILETQKEILEIQVEERTSKIVEQKTIIEKKNKDITDSIVYAKTIQETILPTKELKQQLFPDSFILFKPKDIVSGDFYWFAEKNGRKLIAACDCTGHGVPGALMSMIGNNILNQIVNEKGITAPNEILNHLHKEIRTSLKQEKQNETKDGMDIALISFDNDLEIEFAGAQRPLWIIRTVDINQSHQLIEVKGDKFEIGGLQSETERTFTNHKILLSKGDILYIFSDGFADQFGVTDKKLMTSRFKETLLNIRQKSMHEQEKFLDKFIEDWKGNGEQIDDILVIGIKI